jgi:hypothetical protein
MAEPEQHAHAETVEVTLSITDEQGNTTTTEREIPAGPTPVPTLKDELGIPETESLFLARKDKPKKLLADHAQHNVKQGDHYEVVGKGGAS